MKNVEHEKLHVHRDDSTSSQKILDGLKDHIAILTKDLAIAEDALHAEKIRSTILEEKNADLAKTIASLTEKLTNYIDGL